MHQFVHRMRGTKTLRTRKKRRKLFRKIKIGIAMAALSKGLMGHSFINFPFLDQFE